MLDYNKLHEIYTLLESNKSNYNALIFRRLFDQYLYKIHLCWNLNYKLNNIEQIESVDNIYQKLQEVRKNSYNNGFALPTNIDISYFDFVYNLLSDNINENDIKFKDNRYIELYIIYKLNQICNNAENFEKLKKYIITILQRFNKNNIDINKIQILNNINDLYDNWERFFCEIDKIVCNNSILITNNDYCKLFIKIIEDIDDESMIINTINNYKFFTINIVGYN